MNETIATTPNPRALAESYSASLERLAEAALLQAGEIRDRGTVINRDAVNFQELENCLDEARSAFVFAHGETLQLSRRFRIRGAR